MPPNPPNKAHGFAMRNMSPRDMQISKSEKKKLAPLPNPGHAPAGGVRGKCPAGAHVHVLFIHAFTRKKTSILYAHL